jgi:hypothetical protein
LESDPEVYVPLENKQVLDIPNYQLYWNVPMLLMVLVVMWLVTVAAHVLVTSVKLLVLVLIL